MRELEAETTEDTRLILLGAGTPGPALEAALSEAASLATHLIRGGAGVELIGPGFFVRLGRGPAASAPVLTALALYDPGAPGPAAGESEAGEPGKLRRAAPDPGEARLRCPPLLALRLVTYLMVADGIAALLLAGLIAPLGAGLVGAAVLASWWLERARERGAVTQALSWVLVGLAAVALTVDLLYLAATVLDGMVHVLLFVILARLIMCRSLRDLRDAGFLSFFLLVATASVTFSMGFLAVFVAYLALATWMLMLNHIVTESDQAGRRDLMVTRLGLRGQMIRVSLAAAARHVRHRGASCSS